MKLPRDISGEELASLLTKYGYKVTRQTDSHLGLTSTLKDTEQYASLLCKMSFEKGNERSQEHNNEKWEACHSRSMPHMWH